MCTNKKLIVGCAIMFQFHATFAAAIVYCWVDAAGIRHYVNREHDIPERYRARAKALYPEPGDVASPNRQAVPEQILPVITAPASSQTEIVAPPAALAPKMPEVQTGKRPDRRIRIRTGLESE